MAEAFGIASGVVGIVSFGIQVTQELLKYYGSWKSQDDDISNMYASVESLSERLTILSRKFERFSDVDDTIIGSVESHVNRVEGALKKLSEELGNVRDAESPKQGARSAMRRHVRRLYYPFKEETLNRIKGVVDEVTRDLDLALQVLQVYAHLNMIMDRLC